MLEKKYVIDGIWTNYAWEILYHFFYRVYKFLIVYITTYLGSMKNIFDSKNVFMLWEGMSEYTYSKYILATILSLKILIPTVTYLLQSEISKMDLE